MKAHLCWKREDNILTCTERHNIHHIYGVFDLQDLINTDKLNPIQLELFINGIKTMLSRIASYNAYDHVAILMRAQWLIWINKPQECDQLIKEATKRSDSVLVFKVIKLMYKPKKGA